MNYLTAYAREDFISATQFLYDRNSAHPPEACLKDMPKFVIHVDTLRTRLDINHKAKQYCDYWNSKLEKTMSEFRQKNQEEYNKL